MHALRARYTSISAYATPYSAPDACLCGSRVCTGARDQVTADTDLEEGELMTHSVLDEGIEEGELQDEQDMSSDGDDVGARDRYATGEHSHTDLCMKTCTLSVSAGRPVDVCV